MAFNERGQPYAAKSVASCWLNAHLSCTTVGIAGTVAPQGRSDLRSGKWHKCRVANTTARAPMTLQILLMLKMV
jgi:hypothetical protein